MRNRRKIRAISFQHGVFKADVGQNFIETTVLKSYNSPYTYIKSEFKDLIRLFGRTRKAMKDSAKVSILKSFNHFNGLIQTFATMYDDG